jgi:hypothetical protein
MQASNVHRLNMTRYSQSLLPNQIREISGRSFYGTRGGWGRPWAKIAPAGVAAATSQRLQRKAVIARVLWAFVFL